MLVAAGMSVVAGMAGDHATCPVAAHSGLPHAGDLGCLGMSRKRSPLLVQVLLFLLVTLLGVATGNLTKNPGALPWGLEILRRESLPLAGITVVVIIGMMVWQHRTEELLALPVVGGWDSDRSPFPGLEAFTERDSAVFFGRDAEITELLDRLHPVVAAQANRLVAVVGPSGAGKSSLVQAGVVARLRQRRGGWIVVPPVVPGDHPLRSLARSLAAAYPGHLAADDVQAAHFADELRTAHGRPSAPVLVIVDQAEELITLSGPAERDTFLGLLASALDAGPLLWIIVIMRSEFLTAFLGTEQARLFRDPVAVGTLGHTALVEVIEQPARRAGLTFDPPTLPQRMAADAGGGDALPLLAYALQELCLAAGPGGVLTADAYQRIGGVAGVLTRQADKVTAELGGAAGPVLSTLLRFVTIGENEPTRRRVRRSALTDAQWRVAEAFIAARLLTSHGDGGGAILEVAHEALFRHWAPLQQAIEACTDQLRWRADLERWAKDWDSSGRQDAYLLRDERLKAAQHWAASDSAVVDGLALVAEFLACSNQADRATMQRLSETIARQALGTVDRDPDYSLLLALAAFEECAPTALALRALTAALVASQLRVVLRGHDDGVLRVAWSPDGRRLATVSIDRTARIWDADGGNELAVLRGHNSWVRGVAWSPDGRRLATASSDRTARIWDTDNGSELAVLQGHNDSVWCVAWSLDGQRLATGSRDGTARIWDTNSGSELAVLYGHDAEVREVAWSPDGRRLATASIDRTARIWDTDNGNELTVLRGHDDWVRCVAWSPDGRRLATASSDRTTRIWDRRGNSELATLYGHNGWVQEVAWSPDGRRLATASDDETARIWDADDGSKLTVLQGHNDAVRCVAWSPDGRRLATASNDRTTRIWDTDNGNELTVLQGHNDGVFRVTWSPDGRRLATASNDRTTRIWDADNGNELTVLRGHDDRVWCVAWSPDGRRLATASNDRTARIWDTGSDSELTVLRGHDGEVRGVAWSPDGQRLATGSTDRTVRIWDAESGTEIIVIGVHAKAVDSVSWSPDGRRIASASQDGTARVWDATVSIEDLVANAHRRVSRELSAEERRNLMFPATGD